MHQDQGADTPHHSMVDSDVNIHKIHINSYNHSSRNATVPFKSEDECKKIIDFFAPFLHFGCGYEFETFSGESSKVVVTYSSKKNTIPQNKYDDIQQNKYGDEKSDKQIVIWNIPIETELNELKTVLATKFADFKILTGQTF